MERQHAISLITLAREAYLNGYSITAEVYMRQVLSCANRMADRRAKSRIFTILNKLRPHVSAEWNHLAADIWQESRS